MVPVPLFGAKEEPLYAILLAVGIEILTCYFRFGLKMKASQTTGFIGRFTGGLRVHHGYIGLALVLARNWIPNENLAHAITWVGWACVLSDGAHHFWILWQETGSHEFDFVYPVNRFRWLESLQGHMRESFAFLLIGMCGVTFLLARLGLQYVMYVTEG